ncbi:hypothetical protein HYZ97_03515 [Candidatus Pacearchaeota archaeon]|nr:hypothetical protein [Candidatus Pacearchaeota archaeon]
MPKKRVISSDTTPKKQSLEETLVHNLVELQKVHINLAEKFDKLSQQMTNLLSLFESAARSFAEHPANQATEKDKEFLEKVDKLLEQNKTIAKGLTLVEERIRERVYGSQRPAPTDENKDEYQPSALSKPLPKF